MQGTPLVSTVLLHVRGCANLLSQISLNVIFNVPTRNLKVAQVLHNLFSATSIESSLERSYSSKEIRYVIFRRRPSNRCSRYRASTRTIRGIQWESIKFPRIVLSHVGLPIFPAAWRSVFPTKPLRRRGKLNFPSLWRDGASSQRGNDALYVIRKHRWFSRFSTNGSVAPQLRDTLGK